jgi:hypothetical protein
MQSHTSWEKLVGSCANTKIDVKIKPNHKPQFSKPKKKNHLPVKQGTMMFFLAIFSHYLRNYKIDFV